MKKTALIFALLFFACGAFAAVGDSSTNPLIVPIGKKVTFTVVLPVGGGTPPFIYQWKKNGGDIPGATAESYVISPFAASHAGGYSVVVSNAAGSTRTSDYHVSPPLPPSKGVVNAAVTDPDPVVPTTNL